MWQQYWGVRVAVLEADRWVLSFGFSFMSGLKVALNLRCEMKEMK